MALGRYSPVRYLREWWTELRDRGSTGHLTLRYVIALGVLAGLAIAGQIVIQASLAKQTQAARVLRNLDRQVYLSTTIQRTSLAIQLSSSQKEMASHVLYLDGVVAELIRLSQSSAIEPDPALLKLEARTLELQRVASRRDPQLPTLTREIREWQSLFMSRAQNQSQEYEAQLTREISRFKQIEFLLLLTTLIVLVLEGLYIFRPGVQSLYDALQTRSDFLARMSHELRNPMNSILGMSSLLIETPLTDQQRKYISILRKSSSGLLDLINSLLDFSAIESGKITLERIPFNLYEVLERVMDQGVFGANASRIELILDLDPQIPLNVVGDPLRLQQVLVNLVGNAVKFTPKGYVILKVRERPSAGSPYRLVEFSVIDSGVGIEKDKIRRVFEAFLQEDSSVRRRFGGTGLGLSIARELVALMSGGTGQIEVESQKGVGSRFYFSIPLGLRAEPQSICTAITEAGLARGGDDPGVSPVGGPKLPKLGVIENCREAADPLLRIFTQCGIEVFSPQGDAQVRAVFDSNFEVEGCDAWIMDYEQVKELLMELPVRARKGLRPRARLVCLVRTTASPRDLERLASYGIESFLFKPVKPLQLIEVLSQLIEKPTAAAEPGADSAAAAAPVVDERPLRLLVADDSRDNQFLIQAYLEGTAYRIVFADDGKQALERFQQGKFDLVLLDIQMPEMDGHTAAKLMRQWEAAHGLERTPILAISAHGRQTMAVQLEQGNFDECLTKPISPEHLKKVIYDRTSPTPARPTPQIPAKDPAVLEMEQRIAALVPGFLTNRLKELGTLKGLVEAKDLKKIGTLGHRLKGNALSYGFPQLGLIGARIEECAEKADFEAITVAIGELEKEVTREAARFQITLSG